MVRPRGDPRIATLEKLALAFGRLGRPVSAVGYAFPDGTPIGLRFEPERRQGHAFANYRAVLVSVLEERFGYPDCGAIKAFTEAIGDASLSSDPAGLMLPKAVYDNVRTTLRSKKPLGSRTMRDQ